MKSLNPETRQFFIEHIRNRDFRFILKLDSQNSSSDLINAYNQAHDALMHQLQDATSLTDSILLVHLFNTNQRANLVNMLTQVSKDLWLNKSNAHEHQRLKALGEQLKTLLKTSKRFNAWSSTILSAETLAGRASFVSRDLLPSQPSKAMTYVQSAAFDHKEDLSFVKMNQGIPLPPRFQAEAQDPKHRSWGTLFPYIAHHLKPVFDAWAAKSNKTEDLTVEIEFDDDLRAIEQQFDPQAKVESLEAEDARWFNSYSHYFSPIEVLDYLMTTKNNLLYRGLEGYPLHASDSHEHIFCMDRNGNLFIIQDGQFKNGKRIGHPSFTNGAPVASAGTIKINQGKITEVTNSSGHYLPGGHSLHRVIRELDYRGVLAKDCHIKVFGEFEGTQKEFNEKYGTMDFKVEHKADTPLNLTEKVNPLPLLHCLNKINTYLNDRAGETNRLFATLFNSYNGEDYFKRLSNFQDLLRFMTEANNTKVVEIIQNSLPTFQMGHLRNKYASLLTELQTLLANSNNSLLSHPLVQAHLNEQVHLQDAILDEAKKHKKYHRLSIFSNRDAEKSEIAASSAQYKYLRQSCSLENKTQFEKAQKVMERLDKNMKYW